MNEIRPSIDNFVFSSPFPGHFIILPNVQERRWNKARLSQMSCSVRTSVKAALRGIGEGSESTNPLYYYNHNLHELSWQAKVGGHRCCRYRWEIVVIIRWQLPAEPLQTKQRTHQSPVRGSILSSRLLSIRHTAKNSPTFACVESLEVFGSEHKELDATYHSMHVPWNRRDALEVVVMVMYRFTVLDKHKR